MSLADLSSLGPLVETAPELTTILVTPRNIAGFTANVTIEEQHIDRLRTTDHPVEQGADITDHAFKQAAQVKITAGWSNSSPSAFGNPFYVQSVYSSFLALQASMQLFDITTGKRAYTNMLVESIVETTDSEHQNAMVLTIDCKEIILAQTYTVTVPPAANMTQPQINGATQDIGTQSALESPSTYNPAATPFGTLYNPFSSAGTP